MTPTRLPVPVPAAYLPMTYPSYRPLLLDPAAGAVAVGLCEHGQPVGLAVGRRTGQVLSVFVGPVARRRGLGATLLGALEAELATDGAVDCTAVFSGAADGPAGRLFARAGWSEPRARIYLLRARRERIAELTWAAGVPPLRGLELFPWAELTAADRESILARQRVGDGWYPESLTPFVDEDSLDPDTSLGLRRGGEVVGWQVNHRIDLLTHRFTATWVREDLLKAGRALGLMAETWRRYLATGLPWATMGVQADNAPMLAFVDRRVRPCLDSITPTWGVTKPLREPT